MTQQRLRKVRTDSLRTEPRGSKHGLGEQSLGGDDGWRPPKGLAPAAAAEIAQASGSVSASTGSVRDLSKNETTAQLESNMRERQRQ